MRSVVWRLLRQEPADGAANMARDEALLGSAGRGAPPALRLYGWSRPTLSLGAHQSGSDADLGACRRLGADLVRRPSGGGAVLHDLEVTYSVTGRLGEDPFPGGVIGVYERVGAALIAGLENLRVVAMMARRSTEHRPSPADCFVRASGREILAGGRKLVGSAQLRRRGAFLQHGSILIGFDAARLSAVLRIPRDSADPLGPATLSELMGGAAGRERIEDAIAGGFRRVFCAELEPSELDDREAEEAARLRAFKYLDAEWTLEGKIRRRAHSW